MNLKTVQAAERLLQAYAMGDAALAKWETARIAALHVADQRKTSAPHYRINFDGWDLVVVGEFSDDAPFALESVFLPDSAIDVTDLLGDDELVSFMDNWRTEQEAAHIDEMAYAYSLAA